MGDKTTAIEQNIEKNNRRLEIATQLINWLEHTKTEELRSATLPAKHWYSEHLINNMLEHSRLNLRNIVFHGVESKRNIALQAIKNRPQNSILVNNSLHYLLTRQLDIGRVGIGYIKESVKDADKDYNFIWADFCGTPNKLLIQHCGEYMGTMDKGLFYVTFALSSRQKNGLKGICKTLKISQKNVKDGLINRLAKIAEKNGSKVKPVYSVMYRGGGSYSTNMITLGFLVGRGSAKSIGVIDKDTRVNLIRKQNGSTYQRYRREPILFNGRKKKDVKKSKITEEQKKEVRTLLDRGLSTSVISDKLGIGRGSVGAVASHHLHPNSWNKKKK